jgi:hypothetical protein
MNIYILKYVNFNGKNKNELFNKYFFDFLEIEMYIEDIYINQSKVCHRFEYEAEKKYIHCYYHFKEDLTRTECKDTFRYKKMYNYKKNPKFIFYDFLTNFKFIKSLKN